VPADARHAKGAQQLMARTDWTLTRIADIPSLPTWLFYAFTALFPSIHMSVSLDDPTQWHAATDSQPRDYYYGNLGTFSHTGGGEVAADVQQRLVDAWNSYVRI
jgi:hypothetical protein